MLSLFNLLAVLVKKNLLLKLYNRKLLFIELLLPILCFAFWSRVFLSQKVVPATLNDPTWFNTTDPALYMSTNLTKSAELINNAYTDRCPPSISSHNSSVTNSSNCEYIIGFVGSRAYFSKFITQLYLQALPDYIKNNDTYPKLTSANFRRYASHAELHQNVAHFDGISIAAAIEFKEFGTIYPDPHSGLLVPHYEYTLHTRSYNGSPDSINKDRQKLFDLSSTHYYSLSNLRFPLHNLIQQTILRMEGLFSPPNSSFVRINSEYADDNDLFAIDPTSLDRINFNFTQMPSRVYADGDGPLENMRIPIAFLLSIAFLPTIISFMIQITLEKENSILQMVLVTGATKPLIVSSYFISSWLVNLFTIICITSIQWYYLYQHIGFIIMLVFTATYYTALLSFCFFISSFFSSSKSSNLAIMVIVYLLISMIVLLGDATIPETLQFWLFALFNAQTIFIETHINFFRLDLNYGGITLIPPHNLVNHHNSLIPYYLSLVLLFAQSIFYICLGIYFDNVFNSKTSLKPFYYPILPSYWKSLAARVMHTCRRTTRNRKLRRQLTSINGDPSLSSSTLGQLFNDDGARFYNYDNNMEEPLLLLDDNHMYVSEYIQPLSPQEVQNVGIRIQNLTKTYGNTTVCDSITLDIVRGSIYSIIGKNSTGKSQLISLLSGLIEPTSGSVKIFDRNGQHLKDPFGFIGVCPQGNTLWPTLTPFQTLMIFSNIKQFAMGLILSHEDVVAEITLLLTRLKLEDKTSQLVETLSHGQRRLLCFAIALLHKPPILLLDELSQSCDIQTQLDIVKILQEEKSNQTTIVSTTHILSESDIADRIGILTMGRLHISGSKMFLLEKFSCGYVISLEKKRIMNQSRPSLAHKTPKKASFLNNLTIPPPSPSKSGVNAFHSSRGNPAAITRSGSFSTYIDANKRFVLNGEELGIITTPSGQAIVDTISDKLQDLAEVLSLHCDTINQTQFNVPFDLGDHIPAVLDQLEMIKDELGVQSVSLSVTNLLDIFLMATNNAVSVVSTDCDDDAIANRYNHLDTPSMSSDENSLDGSELELESVHHQQVNRLSVDTAVRVKITTDIWDRVYKPPPPIKLWFIQLFALLYRRIIQRMRDKYALLTRVIIPIILSLICLLIGLQFLNEQTITVDYSLFPEFTPIPFSYLDPVSTQYDLTGANCFSQAFSTYRRSHPIHTDISQYFQYYDKNPWDISHNDIFPHTIATQINTIPGYFLNHTSYLIGLNTTANAQNYSNPLYFGINVYNAARNFTDQSVDAVGTIYVNTTSQFTGISALTRLYETVSEYYKASPSGNGLGTLRILSHESSLPSELNHLISTSSAWLGVVLCFIIFPQSIIHTLVRERETNLFHIIRLTGTSLGAYWMSHFLCDFGEYVIVCAILVIPWLFESTPHLPIDLIAFSFVVFGVSTILLTYTIQYFFTNPSTAQRYLALYLLLIPLVLSYFSVDYLFEDISASATGAYPSIITILIFFAAPSTVLISPIYLMKSRRSGYNTNYNLTWLTLYWLCCVPVYILGIYIMQFIYDKQLFSTAPLQPVQNSSSRAVDVDVEKMRKKIQHAVQQHHSIDPPPSSNDINMSMSSPNPSDNLLNTSPIVCHGARKVYKSNGKIAVNNVYFDAKRHSITMLLGPRASGKSSLIKSLVFATPMTHTSTQHSNHTAFINGMDIKNHMGQLFNNTIGWVPQDDDALLEAFTARETFFFFSWLRGVTRDRAKLFVDDLLSSLNLQHHADRAVGGLSGGLKRRVSIGVALIGGPQIILCDQATSQVDALSRRAIQLLLQHTTKWRTLLLSTDLLDDVECADNVLLMSKGDIIAAGSPIELKEKLGKEFVITVQTVLEKELFIAISLLSLLCNIPVPVALLKMLVQYATPYIPTVSNYTHEVPLRNSLSPSSSLLSKHFTKSHKMSNHSLSLNLDNPTNSMVATHFSQVKPLAEADVKKLAEYSTFIADCEKKGARIYDERYTQVTINVRHDLCSLSQLFTFLQKAKKQFSEEIQNFSVSPMSLEQVYLDTLRKIDEIDEQ